MHNKRNPSKAKKDHWPARKRRTGLMYHTKPECHLLNVNKNSYRHYFKRQKRTYTCWSLFAINLTHAPKLFRTATIYISIRLLLLTLETYDGIAGEFELKVSSLRNFASEHGIDIFKKWKEDLVKELLLCQNLTSVLTPIIRQTSDY